MPAMVLQAQTTKPQLVHLHSGSVTIYKTDQSQCAYGGCDYFHHESQHQNKTGDLLNRFSEPYIGGAGKISYDVHASRFGTNENFLLTEDPASKKADFKATDAAKTEAFRAGFKNSLPT